MMMKARVALLVGLALGSPAAAHDLWLVPRPLRVAPGSELRLLAQTGMKFPESLSAVTPVRLEGFWVLDSEGRREVKTARVEEKSLVATVGVERPGVLLAAMAVKPNFIAIKAAEFNEYLEHDGLPQILEQRKSRGELGLDVREMYAKFAKAIVRVGESGPSDLATQPAGLRLEMVPRKDPSTFGAGERLPVEVLFEGKPLAGVYVYALAEGEEKYRDGYITDAQGKAELPLSRLGLMSLHSIFMRPHADKTKADWESFFATVTFEVGTAR